MIWLKSNGSEGIEAIRCAVANTVASLRNNKGDDKSGEILIAPITLEEVFSRPQKADNTAPGKDPGYLHAFVIIIFVYFQKHQ